MSLKNWSSEIAVKGFVLLPKTTAEITAKSGLDKKAVCGSDQ